ncbi:SpdA protein [Streptomyces sp. NPDC005551]|uniref:SpdA protein n=1 Tax=Streptomyces sp. NPDC005551 TaxID=3364725 RepID=UPI00368ACFB9
MPGETFTRVFITVDSALVILLAFLFAFGNGWDTALMLGVNLYIAPLIQPAVDLAVIGLMVGLRYLAVHGWTDEQLKMPRRWLRTFGLMTLAMNTALPLSEQHWGRAAWDAIGPVLLIAWSELAPWLLRAIYSVRQEVAAQTVQAREAAQASEKKPKKNRKPKTVKKPTAIPPTPPPPHSVVTITTGEPRVVVRNWLLDWDRNGRTYADNPAAALKKLRRANPKAVRIVPDVGDRRIGQLCTEEWDRLHSTGLVSTPRAA